MFADLLDMGMSYIQYLSLLLKLSPATIPLFFTNAINIFSYAIAGLSSSDDETRRYTNYLKIDIPDWIPLDIRLQYVLLAVVGPLVVTTFGLLFVYGKFAYFWFLCALAALFMFLFGFILLANMGIFETPGASLPSHTALSAIGAIGFPSFVLLVAGGLVGMGRSRLRVLREDATAMAKQIAIERRRRRRQRVTQQMVDRHGIDLVAVAAQQVYLKRDRAWVRHANGGDVTFQSLLALMCLMGGCVLLGVVPISSIAAMQSSLVFTVLGVLALLLFSAVALWAVLGTFLAGRRLQYTLCDFAGSRCLGLVVTVCNLFYMYVITNFVSLLYCVDLVCEAGSRTPYAASLFPSLADVSSDSNAADVVEGGSVGCVACDASAYPQACRASWQRQMCASTVHQRRLVYDTSVRCDEVDVFFKVSGSIIFVSYLTFLPYLQFYMAQYTVHVLKESYPLEQRYYEVFTEEEIYFQKVLSSGNNAGFAYRAYKPHYRFYRLSFLLQKVVLGVVGCITRQGLSHDYAWGGMLIFVVVSLTAVTCAAFFQPFARSVELIFFISTQAMLCVCSLVCLIGQRLGIGGVPDGIWVALLVFLVGVPVITLITGNAWALREERRWSDLWQQRLVEEVTTAYASPSGLESDALGGAGGGSLQPSQKGGGGGARPGQVTARPEASARWAAGIVESEVTEETGGMAARSSYDVDRRGIRPHRHREEEEEKGKEGEQKGGDPASPTYRDALTLDMDAPAAPLPGRTSPFSSAPAAAAVNSTRAKSLNSSSGLRRRRPRSRTDDLDDVAFDTNPDQQRQQETQQLAVAALMSRAVSPHRSSGSHRVPFPEPRSHRRGSVAATIMGTEPETWRTAVRSTAPYSGDGHSPVEGDESEDGHDNRYEKERTLSVGAATTRALHQWRAMRELPGFSPAETWRGSVMVAIDLAVKTMVAPFLPSRAAQAAAHVAAEPVMEDRPPQGITQERTSAAVTPTSAPASRKAGAHPAAVPRATTTTTTASTTGAMAALNLEGPWLAVNGAATATINSPLRRQLLQLAADLAQERAAAAETRRSRLAFGGGGAPEGLLESSDATLSTSRLLANTLLPRGAAGAAGAADFGTTLRNRRPASPGSAVVPLLGQTLRGTHAAKEASWRSLPGGDTVRPETAAVRGSVLRSQAREMKAATAAVASRSEYAQEDRVGFVPSLYFDSQAPTRWRMRKQERPSNDQTLRRGSLSYSGVGGSGRFSTSVNARSGAAGEHDEHAGGASRAQRERRLSLTLPHALRNVRLPWIQLRRRRSSASAAAVTVDGGHEFARSPLVGNPTSRTARLDAVSDTPVGTTRAPSPLARHGSRQSGGEDRPAVSVNVPAPLIPSTTTVHAQSSLWSWMCNVAASAAETLCFVFVKLCAMLAQWWRVCWSVITSVDSAALRRRRYVLSFTEVYARRQLCASERFHAQNSSTTLPLGGGVVTASRAPSALHALPYVMGTRTGNSPTHHRHQDRRATRPLAGQRRSFVGDDSIPVTAFWGSLTDAMLGVVEVPGSMPPWALYCNAPPPPSLPLLASAGATVDVAQLPMIALQQQYLTQLAAKAAREKRAELQRAKENTPPAPLRGDKPRNLIIADAYARQAAALEAAAARAVAGPTHTRGTGCLLPLDTEMEAYAAEEAAAAAAINYELAGEGGEEDRSAEGEEADAWGQTRRSRAGAMAGLGRKHWLEQWGPVLTELLYEAALDEEEEEEEEDRGHKRKRKESKSEDSNGGAHLSSSSSSEASSTHSLLFAASRCRPASTTSPTIARPNAWPSPFARFLAWLKTRRRFPWQNDDRDDDDTTSTPLNARAQHRRESAAASPGTRCASVVSVNASMAGAPRRRQSNLLCLITGIDALQPRVEAAATRLRHTTNTAGAQADSGDEDDSDVHAWATGNRLGEDWHSPFADSGTLPTAHTARADRLPPLLTDVMHRPPEQEMEEEVEAGPQDPLIQQIRCLHLVRERLKESYWGHRAQLAAVQTYIDYEINDSMRRILTYLFLVVGLLATVSLTLALLGMLHTREWRFIGGVLRSDQGDDLRYQLAGYANWIAFTENCCCVAATAVKASYPYYAIDMENWVCANGITKERIRRDGYDGDIVDGYEVRGLCAMTFKHHCAVAVDEVARTATLTDCDAEMVTPAARKRW